MWRAWCGLWSHVAHHMLGWTTATLPLITPGYDRPRSTNITERYKVDGGLRIRLMGFTIVITEQPYDAATLKPSAANNF